MTSQPLKILLVEPNLDGHHAFYLSLIMKALEGAHVTLLTCKNRSQLEPHYERLNINLRSLYICETTIIKKEAVYSKACKMTENEAFDKVFIPYLDHYLPLILKAKRELLKAPISGIWFHPHALDGFYRWIPPLDKRARERGTINRRLRSLERPQVFEHLFFLDPKAPGRLQAINQTISCSIIPDPGERAPNLGKSDARKKFDLPQDRLIFLHVGSPEKRKGLPDAIRAFSEIVHEITSENRNFLLRIGPNRHLDKYHQKQLKTLIDSGHARVSDEYVSSEDLIDYFAAADVILIPYRNFRFSSGILSNALLAQRPVIASDYGMIGQRVQSESAGIVFKHKSVPKLKKAIRSFTANLSEYCRKTQKQPNLDLEEFVNILKRQLKID